MVIPGENIIPASHVPTGPYERMPMMPPIFEARVVIHDALLLRSEAESLRRRCPFCCGDLGAAVLYGCVLPPPAASPVFSAPAPREPLRPRVFRPEAP